MRARPPTGPNPVVRLFRGLPWEMVAEVLMYLETFDAVAALRVVTANKRDRRHLLGCIRSLGCRWSLRRNQLSYW